MEDLLERRNVYLKILEGADGPKRRRYTRIVAQYDQAIKKVEKGETVGTEDLPNPPGLPPLPSHIPLALNSHSTDSAVNVKNDVPDDNNLVVDEEKKRSQVIPAPGPVSVPTVLVDYTSNDTVTTNDLEDRLKTYKEVLNDAREAGVTPKIRRYERIVKQYQQAIEFLAKGKPVDFSELPNPPGFAPLVPIDPSVSSATSSRAGSREPSPEPSPLPVDKKDHNNMTTVGKKPQNAASGPSPPRSRAEAQTALLVQRRADYRAQALQEKTSGNRTEALRLLRLAKGFDRLILASQSGLPVDLSSIPPSLTSSSSSSSPTLSLTTATTNTILCEKKSEEVAQILVDQLEWLARMREARLIAGDIANANRLERFEAETKRSLQLYTAQQKQPTCKLYMQSQQWTIPRCIASLPANTLEGVVHHAQGLPAAFASCSCYVRIRSKGFEGVDDCTMAVKSSSSTIDGNNGGREWRWNFENRWPVGGAGDNGKLWPKAVRRGRLIFEVWSKGGIFAKDQLVGECAVPLVPLQTDVTWSGSVTLMNGRRPVAVGCTLHVTIRAKTPVLPTTDSIEKNLYFLKSLQSSR